jgi:hypothetical protein
MSKELLWPGGKRVAVLFNTCLEAWSEGKAPGISPMGNPLPAGVLDNMAISWASYGYKKGIYRLLDAFAKHGIPSSVMINGVIAERAPEAVRAVADAGHEILSHSYAMDVIPVLMDEAAERANITRCQDLLQNASGKAIRGWLSPRGTPSANTARLLAEAGFLWYGDVFDDDLPYVQTIGGHRIVAIPLGTDVNDMPFMKYGAPPRQMLDSFTQNLEVAADHGQTCVIDVTNHAHIFGRPRGAYFYAQIMAEAVKSGAWIATRAQMAEHVLAHNGG